MAMSSTEWLTSPTTRILPFAWTSIASPNAPATPTVVDTWPSPPPNPESRSPASAEAGPAMPAIIANAAIEQSANPRMFPLISPSPGSDPAQQTTPRPAWQARPLSEEPGRAELVRVDGERNVPGRDRDVPRVALLRSERRQRPSVAAEGSVEVAGCRPGGPEDTTSSQSRTTPSGIDLRMCDLLPLGRRAGRFREPGRGTADHALH